MRENQVVEWKEKWKDEFIKWICGFANSQGGTLIIGKNDKGEMIGIKNAKKLLEDIPNKIRDLLGIIVEVHMRIENNKEYLEIKVDAYPYPVNYKGQYHIRSGSTKQELKGAALDTFLLKKYGLHWDNIPIPYLTLDKLDQSAFLIFKEKALNGGRLDESDMNEDMKMVLSKLHLLEGGKIRRAAVLLFGKDPEAFVTGAIIKIGFFRTNDDLVYQDVIEGNLFSQVEKTLDLLISKYMKAYITYDGLLRIEKYLFPKAALREALLNAVVHKDYSSENPIQISVYEDKIMIWNAGHLPDQITLESLQGKHPSIPFNPLIASAFFRAGYIEAWGRGIEKINKECKKYGVESPAISIDFGGMQVVFKVDISFEENLNKLGETSGNMSGKTSGKIINLINNNQRITIPELAEAINITERSIERNVQKLKKDGIIERIGSAKGGYWEIIK